MSLAHDDEIVKLDAVTQDSFLDGRLSIAQPANGFRAGLDSVLLGAAVGEGRRTLLDLGAGAGTVALVALSANAQRSATLVELDPEMAALATHNSAANGFATRARVIALDLTAAGRVRTAAGLEREAYDAVIANPPFYERGSAPSPQRAAARAMHPEALDLWVKTAATHAAPAGEIIFIHTADRLPELLEAFRRFGAVTVLPLTPRDGEPAHRILVRGIKGSRAPFQLLASRALHTASGRGFRAEFEAIFRGSDQLHW